MFQRGGPLAPMCGARTRNGGVCANPPILEGKGRCLSHCGPKAAIAFRERQKQRFEAGQISAVEWNRAETRRAANRLGDAWKKNPWLPGSTIDLGEHEAMFVEALGDIDVARLAPAVADWLRWKYQRLQIDTRNDAAWLNVRLNKLVTRIARAGERPSEQSSVDFACQAWRPSERPLNGSSRRSRLDSPKAPKVIRGKGYARPGRPQTQPADAGEHDELIRLYREHTHTLRPIMEMAKEDGKQLYVLRTLRAYLQQPQNTDAHQRWMALVTATLVPPMKSNGAL